LFYYPVVLAVQQIVRELGFSNVIDAFLSGEASEVSA